MVKIGHCTDFSKNAEKALEAVLFNFWSFDVTVDLIHLVEGDYKEAQDQLELYKQELINCHGVRMNFKTYLFDKGENEALVEHLNSEDYYGLLVGLEGEGKKAGIGSFLAILYKHYKGGMTVVPLHHEIKIENKVLVAVEYENMEELYALVKFRSFLNFQFSKLCVLIRAKDELKQQQVLEIEELLAEMLPLLKKELLILNYDECSDYIAKEIKEKQLDYYIIFKDDYFDKYIFNMVLNKPSGNDYKERLIRLCTPQEELLRLKRNEGVVRGLNLRLE